MKFVSIADFKMPKSCSVCRLKTEGMFSKQSYCIFDKVCDDVDAYRHCRHRDCPLKEEETNDDIR